MQIEFLTPDNGRWQEFLASVPHDYYHLPEYLALAAEQEGGQAECVLATAGSEYVFLPYIVCRLDDSFPGAGDGLIDLHSPYGYPGPLCSSQPKFVQQATKAWSDEMRRRRAVSGFIRFHPALNHAAPAFASLGDLVHRNPTVSIDVSQPESEIWGQFRRNHRRDIRKAEKLGFSTQIVPAADDIDSFAELYYESMDRLDADETYYISPRILQRLAEALPRELWLCLARAPDGELISSLLFSECQQLVQCQLIGTRNKWLHARPDKLLYYAVSRWAGARGNRWVHLGGGVGAKQDDVFHFKLGFSQITHDFATWHMIFLPSEYQQLTGLSPLGAPDFFPAYRRAGPTPQPHDCKQSCIA